MHRLSLTIAVTALALALSPSSAIAQATRTWVSGVGDDTFPCSRTAPCKTFAGAILKTAAGGEINVLDPGSYGAVTITKSLTIDASGNFAGTLATLGINGIIINAAATDVVHLRGLTIDGAGSGANGIRFLAGAALHVEDCVIRGFQAATAGNGHGITFVPSGASELFVSDTVISANGTGSNGGGILIKPSGSGSAKVNLEEVRMHNNVFGFKADGSVATGAAGIAAVIRDSSSSGNGFGGITALGGTQSVNVFVDHCAVNSNGTTGLATSGLGAILRYTNTTVTGNATGLQFAAPAQLISFESNNVAGNTSDGAPSSSVIQN
ncbi:MAG TPA: hypothetical protein VG477_11035 [Thermoanaerobaculia bacterium]|nr:hypothetical protein [Thermoanaerobaculia bacterium]